MSAVPGLFCLLATASPAGMAPDRDAEAVCRCWYVFLRLCVSVCAPVSPSIGLFFAATGLCCRCNMDTVMNTDDAWPGMADRPWPMALWQASHRHICVRACSTVQHREVDVPCARACIEFKFGGGAAGPSRDRAHICQTLTPRAVFSIGAAAMAVVVRA